MHFQLTKDLIGHNPILRQGASVFWFTDVLPHLFQSLNVCLTSVFHKMVFDFKKYK
jgi:hypothetical protein